MTDKLNQAADEVMIASTTGNPDLYQEKVGNLIKAVRAAALSAPAQMTDEELHEEALAVWATTTGWNLTRDDFIRLSYFHGCMENGSDGKGPINGSEDRPGDVVYKSPDGHCLTRAMVSYWFSDSNAFVHGYKKGVRAIESRALSSAAGQEAVAWIVFDGTDPAYCAGYESACHEHINDAINQYDILDAAKWKVRPVYAAPAKPQEQPVAAQQDVKPLGWAIVRDGKVLCIGDDEFELIKKRAASPRSYEGEVVIVCSLPVPEYAPTASYMAEYAARYEQASKQLRGETAVHPAQAPQQEGQARELPPLTVRSLENAGFEIAQTPQQEAMWKHCAHNGGSCTCTPAERIKCAPHAKSQQEAGQARELPQGLQAAIDAMNRAKKLPVWDAIDHRLHVELDVIFKALASAPAQPTVPVPREASDEWIDAVVRADQPLLAKDCKAWGDLRYEAARWHAAMIAAAAPAAQKGEKG